MSHFHSATSNGAAATFAVMGLIYFAFMMFGVLSVRVPAAGWKPAGAAAAAGVRQVPAGTNVEVNQAMRTPQFWLLWWVLCLNVTAGIGVLSQASPMIQEVSHGAIKAAAAAGFVGLLSLANMLGRFFWSSTSDYIGRRATYTTFFLLGATLYALVPTLGRLDTVALFVLGYVVILSMYGGGFATIPAYLRDMFGTMEVGAIHGRLLTAWSAAGILGPVLVNYIREYRIAQGVPKA
jgi:MFS family permease